MRQVQAKAPPVAPVLAQGLQDILLTESAPKSRNRGRRPKAVAPAPATFKKTSFAKKRAPLPDLLIGEEVSPGSAFPTVPAESLQTGPLTEHQVSPRNQTITGRDIAEGPPVRKVTGADDTEFKGVLKKNECTGEILNHFIAKIEEDLLGLPFAVSIAIPTIEDTPLIAISQGFVNLTGYSQEEIVGRNCRFLLEGVPKDEIQAQTRQESRRYCRAAYLRGLTRLSHTFLIQRNARKSGELFWNLFMLALVPIPGSQPWIIGLQLDLGPTLDLESGSDIASAILPHANNLQIVMHMLFGNNLGQQLDLGKPTKGEGMSQFDEMASKMGLADDVKKWVLAAQSCSNFYQEQGTLPLVMWPITSKYALLNGGSTLLRLEAMETPRGGVAMSVFPVRKAPTGCSFKVRIDEVCDFEVDVSKGAWIPSLGFTDVEPADMDGIGGLPCLIETTARSVCLRGDGSMFAWSEKEHWMIREPTPLVDECAVQLSQYVIKAGDTLECLWRQGHFQVSVGSDGEYSSILYKITDPAIPRPAKTPMYALIDCSYASCKATLVQ